MTKRKQKKKPQNQKLTEQQKRFVQELFKHNHNGKQAAIAAGYSEKSAEVTASRLLRNAKVLEYRENLLKDLEKASIATVEEILEYYTRVMRREEKESVVVTIKEKVTGMFVNPETGEKERKVIETETPKVVEIPTRVVDANKAAEMLGKNFGIWTEKIKLDKEEPITFVEDLPDDE
jgi:phage terminase small subunit